MILADPTSDIDLGGGGLSDGPFACGLPQPEGQDDNHVTLVRGSDGMIR
jgi:hypothetical protein